MQVEVITLTKDELSDLMRQAATLALVSMRDQMQPPPSSIMTKAEVAIYLRKSVPTINRLMREKAIPFEKLDKGHPRFYKSQIDKWLERI